MTAQRTLLTPARLCLLCGIVMLSLLMPSLHQIGDHGIDLPGLISGAEQVRGMTLILLRYSWLPRLVAALIGGAGLALAGVLLQQTLRNPLASPTTLGVAAGAQLALLVAMLWAPALLVFSRAGVAFVGGAIAIGIVLMLGWRHRLAPAILVLAGMVVNLYLGTLSMVLVLMHQQALQGVLIWAGGSLVQDNWDGVLFLLSRMALAGVAATGLARALTLLELNEDNARSLGVSLFWLRLVSLGLAVFVTACVVTQLGVIGFVGLAAPAIIRLAGARTFRTRLMWSPVFGALLLALTDQALQITAASHAMFIPTGAATAALGAPLLIWLIPRLTRRGRNSVVAKAANFPRHPWPRRLIGLLMVAALAMVIVAVLLGQGVDGWYWAQPGDQVSGWRLPRVVAAAAAGLLLALAGTLIQRVSGNPMASPEVLGISAGAGLGFLAVTWFVVTPGLPLALMGGTVGALFTLCILIVTNARSEFESERLLLTGISMMFLFGAVLKILLAGGDPRLQGVLAWMSGSTWHVGPTMAWAMAMLAGLACVLCWPLAGWLDLLPLGAPTARSLGVSVRRSRLLLLVMLAIMTAAATLVVGPLGFIGLLAPHMARMLGLARAREHMAGAMVIGALLMILADWLGRQLIFPTELPAGMVATLIGGSYFMWLMRRL